jgi:hypothetical protein
MSPCLEGVPVQGHWDETGSPFADGAPVKSQRENVLVGRAPLPKGFPLKVHRVDVDRSPLQQGVPVKGHRVDVNGVPFP